MKPSTLISGIAVVIATASTLHAAPYTDWQFDYTGNEANTLLLWKFDQPSPRTDSSGNGKTAVLASPNPNATTGEEDGKFGQSYYSGTYSNANDSFAQAYSSTSLMSNAALSVEFWYRPLDSAIASSNHAYFFDKKFNTTSGIYLRLNNTGGETGTLDLSVGNGSNSASLRTDSLVWSADTWYHIAVTFENVDGDGILKIFRDGNVLAETTADGFGDIATGSNLWRMGNRLGSGYGSVPGYFDNFRISSVAYEYAAIPEPGTTALLLTAVTFGALRLGMKQANRNRK